mmetsp:Transcript_20978/g.60615  ORF Transcript_20978/g.60615 Transcript_20978/m.60615 type:complete len:219 (-) Transcript_20978:565-1221(-)
MANTGKPTRCVPRAMRWEFERMVTWRHAMSNSLGKVSAETGHEIADSVASCSLALSATVKSEHRARRPQPRPQWNRSQCFSLTSMVFWPLSCGTSEFPPASCRKKSTGLRCTRPETSFAISWIRLQPSNSCLSTIHRGRLSGSSVHSAKLLNHNATKFRKASIVSCLAFGKCLSGALQTRSNPLAKTFRFSLKFHSARLTADSDKFAKMPSISAVADV